GHLVRGQPHARARRHRLHQSTPRVDQALQCAAQPRAQSQDADGTRDEIPRAAAPARREEGRVLEEHPVRARDGGAAALGAGQMIEAVLGWIDRQGGMLVAPKRTLAELHQDEGVRDGTWVLVAYLLAAHVDDVIAALARVVSLGDAGALLSGAADVAIGLV